MVGAAVDRAFASRPVVEDLAVAAVVRLCTLDAAGLSPIRLLVERSGDANVKISAMCLRCLNTLAGDHVGSTKVCDIFEQVCAQLSVCLQSSKMDVCTAALPLVTSLYALKGDTLRELLRIDKSLVLPAVQMVLGVSSPTAPEKHGNDDEPPPFTVSNETAQTLFQSSSAGLR